MFLYLFIYISSICNIARLYCLLPHALLFSYAWCVCTFGFTSCFSFWYLKLCLLGV
ncbi:hypothetical protein Hanom_Chr17g01572391 [Helianthus anomalus]